MSESVVDLASGYAKTIKESNAPGQEIDRWTQFLKGTQEYFSELSKPVTSAYESGVSEIQKTSAYDISQAYSNYKKQQLSLQMQNQLGTGFKQELGSELKTAYDTTYESLEQQRESNLSKLKTSYLESLSELEADYDEAVAEGEAKFAEMGKQAQTLDRYIIQYATEKGIAPMVEGVHYVTHELEDGSTKTVLTDEGRLWYSDVFENEVEFENWLKGSSDDPTDPELAKREELLEAYRKDPYAFKYAIAGIDESFKAEDVRQKLADEQAAVERGLKESAYESVSSLDDNTKMAFNASYGKNFEQISYPQAQKIIKNLQRNDNYFSTMSSTVVGFKNTSFTDDYGKQWHTKTNNLHYTPGSSVPGDKSAKNLAKELGILTEKGWINSENNYKQGDIIYHNHKFYLITKLTNKTFAYREVARGEAGIVG